MMLNSACASDPDYAILFTNSVFLSPFYLAQRTMTNDEFGLFVSRLAGHLGLQFRLGERSLSNNTIGSEKGLLPLVVHKVNEVIEVTRGQRKSHADYLTPADSTHLLGMQVAKLPVMDEAFLGLYARQALVILAHPPQHRLLPQDLTHAALPKSSDLLPHIMQTHFFEHFNAEAFDHTMSPR